MAVRYTIAYYGLHRQTRRTCFGLIYFFKNQMALFSQRKNVGTKTFPKTSGYSRLEDAASVSEMYYVTTTRVSNSINVRTLVTAQTQYQNACVHNVHKQREKFFCVPLIKSHRILIETLALVG